MSRHTMNVTLPIGPEDLGAEVELAITFDFHKAVREQGPSYSSGGQPAEPAFVEFVSAKGPLRGDAFDDLRQASFNGLAERYLESGSGQAEALEHADDDDERGREFAAELRAER